MDPRWSVSLFLDHESNAGSARENEGMNSLGLRLGFGL
ncbi:acyloxyacyl hydrolase [Siccirubricoccus deserti]